jgi:AAA domain, putative AbiEii toxin, Type IV TA system
MRIRSISFSGGHSAVVPEVGVVAIVGPNNSGKSAALREIFDHLGTGSRPEHNPFRVVPQITALRQGEPDDLHRWLEEHAQAITDRSNGHRIYSCPGGRISSHDAHNQWQAHAAVPATGPVLAPFLVLPSYTEQRLALVQTAQHWNPLNESPTQPLQILFADPAREAQLSSLSQEAFGEPLHLSRFPGGPIDLYVGTPSAPVSATSINREYVQEVSGMPLLSEQGDGMRSFVGIMLALTCGHYEIVLLDEPEAFLHPPQERLLGRRLAAEAERTQVLVATHSVDFLIGLLTSGFPTVTVVRLTREGDRNHVAVLSADAIREIWSDPLLASSNLLGGLFHRGVVLCESDADARYYSSVLEAARGDTAHDLFFTHCSGKTRMPMVIRALRGLKVPVVAIADIDLLRERSDVTLTLNALGGEWEECATNWNVLESAVREKSAAPGIDDVRERIRLILDGAAVGGPRLPRSASDSIRAATKVDDGWTTIKNGGTAVFPTGDPTVRGLALIEQCRDHGLFLVPVGEMEGWHREVPDHGPRWLDGVVSKSLHETDGPHREFMTSVDAWFDRHQGGSS